MTSTAILSKEAQSDRKKVISLHEASEVSIEQFASIADIDQSEWDRMAGENVRASHGLLSVIEETRVIKHSSLYFLARKNGHLVGAITCYLEESANPDGAVPLGGHRLDKMMVGRLAKAARFSGVITLPCLMCGGQMDARDPFVIRPDTSALESTRIAEALVEAIEQTARRESWGVCFRQVKREESPLREVLTKRGYLRGAEQPMACLELKPEWKCFGDYRQHLKKDHASTAKTILNELNRAKKVGLAIERYDEPGPHYEAFHRLMETHNRTHNGKGFPFRAEFFERLKARLGDRAMFYGARLDGRWVGVSLCFQGGGDVIGSTIGIDAEANRSAGVYFNLAYNSLIEQSIADGRRRIYYGSLLWDMKARRGCGCLESDFYIRGRNWLQQAMLRPVVRARSLKHDAMSAPLRHPGEAVAKATR